MMRVLLVGSGTGGHFYPLIAVAETLKDKFGDQAELFFMGPDAYNPDSLKSHDIKFIYCPSGKQRLYRSIWNYLDFFKIIAGFFIAIIKLWSIYPDVIMSKGGYTSIPVVLAGWCLRIPIVVHESDAVAGRANKIGGKLATYIAVAHKEAASYFPQDKVAHTGMPIRKSFFKKTNNPHQFLGLPTERPVIFITGGSSGAKRINNLILNSLDDLIGNYTIVHQTGKEHEKNVRSSAQQLLSQDDQQYYFIRGSMDAEQFAAAQDAASIIISRAGSGSIFEIALKGKPSILIPIPEDISRDQRSNAYAYASSGAASVLEEENLTDDLLKAEIDYILEDESVYEKMQKAALNFSDGRAGEILTETIADIAKKHGSI